MLKDSHEKKLSEPRSKITSAEARRIAAQERVGGFAVAREYVDSLNG